MNNYEDTAAVAATDTATPVACEPKISPWTKNLIGQRFNRLVVQQFAGYTPKHHAQWVCLCDCGNTKVIKAASFLRGNIKSCGCMLKEMYAASKGRKNGNRHKPLWRLWRGMIGRCHNPNASNYKNYGGRGIFVCDEWRHSYEKFILDAGERPSNYYSLDRIDVNLGYSKENCRWATAKEQQNNRRCNHVIEFRGEKKTITEWADGLGLTATALRLRLTAGCWDLDVAMTTPAQRKGPLPERKRPSFLQDCY